MPSVAPSTPGVYHVVRRIPVCVHVEEEEERDQEGNDQEGRNGLRCKYSTLRTGS